LLTSGLSKDGLLVCIYNLSGAANPVWRKKNILSVSTRLRLILHENKDPFQLCTRPVEGESALWCRIVCTDFMEVRSHVLALFL